jgi:hypothetical protein
MSRAHYVRREGRSGEWGRLYDALGGIGVPLGADGVVATRSDHADPGGVDHDGSLVTATHDGSEERRQVLQELVRVIQTGQ